MKIENKINISIILIFITAFLTIFFIIRPIFKGIEANSKELISQKEEFAVLETKIFNLEKFKIIYKGLEEILEKIENLFVNSDVPVEFIGFLEETSANCDLEINIASVQEKKGENNPWQPLFFQITNTGRFPNFLRFLEKIENSKYLIEIKNLNIIRLEKEAGIRAGFSLKVYTD